MLKRISSIIQDNILTILDWANMIGSVLFLGIILYFNFFGVPDLPKEIAALLFLLGLLSVSRYLGHKMQKITQDAAEHAFHAVQSLEPQLANSQYKLATLDMHLNDLNATQTTFSQNLQTLSGAVKSLTENKIYPSQEKAYECLQSYLTHHQVKEAVFLQYSCKKSEMLLASLLTYAKARATVYIQHEDVPTQLQSERQVDRITSTLRNSLSDLSHNLSDPSRLTVYKFKTPASVRAIRFDDEILCVGWYTYERVNRTDRPTFSHDQTAISGHDRPTLVAWKGTEEYEILNQMVSVMIGNYQCHAEPVVL